jgi:hypothetical protein
MKMLCMYIYIYILACVYVHMCGVVMSVCYLQLMWSSVGAGVRGCCLIREK